MGQRKYAVVLVPASSGDGDGMCSDPSSIKNIMLAGMETASQDKLYIYHSVARGRIEKRLSSTCKETIQSIHLVTNDW